MIMLSKQIVQQIKQLRAYVRLQDEISKSNKIMSESFDEMKVISGIVSKIRNIQMKKALTQKFVSTYLKSLQKILEYLNGPKSHPEIKKFTSEMQPETIRIIKNIIQSFYYRILYSIPNEISDIPISEMHSLKRKTQERILEHLKTYNEFVSLASKYPHEFNISLQIIKSYLDNILIKLEYSV